MKFLAISFLAAIHCARDRQPHLESPSPLATSGEGAGGEEIKTTFQFFQAPSRYLSTHHS